VDDITLSLPVIEALADDGGYAGLAALSNESAALILSAAFWMADLSNWTGDGLALTDSETDKIEAMIAEMEYEVMISAIGLIMPFPGPTIPSWALLCDGDEYLAVDYPELWDILQHEFQASYDSFYTPDLVNRVPVGAGDAYDLSDAVGSATVTLTQSQIPAHTHSYSRPASLTNLQGEIPDVIAVKGPQFNRTTGSTGGGQSHSNVQPSLGLNYIIVSGRYTDHG